MPLLPLTHPRNVSFYCDLSACHGKCPWGIRAVSWSSLWLAGCGPVLVFPWFCFNRWNVQLEPRVGSGITTSWVLLGSAGVQVRVLSGWVGPTWLSGILMVSNPTDTDLVVLTSYMWIWECMAFWPTDAEIPSCTWVPGRDVKFWNKWKQGSEERNKAGVESKLQIFTGYLWPLQI